jgi:hypothetical protein
MMFSRSLKSSALISLTVVLAIAQPCLAQDSSGNTSWTAASEQGNPSGAANPTRTRQTHTEVDGRVVDKTSVEALGPDGRYVPYQDTERESVRVNDTTVRNVERTFGRGPDGQRSLIQERQEESRSLPDGEKKMVSTTLSPDGNGALQVVRRESMDSKQVSPGVRDTKTTVFTPDINGGLAPTVQIEEREKQNDASMVEFKKSTLLSDGAGHWTLSEIREGTTKKESGASSTEERILRPDSNGKLGLVERTVSRQAEAGPGEKRDAVETYSTHVPGKAGDDSMQLVQRESTVRRTSAADGETATRVVERPNPGDPGAGLHVTQEAIDIVRPGANGVAQQQSTILTSDPDGRMNTVWIDMGKSDKPAVQVDTKAGTKAK